jgi:hypothetical protein
MFSDPDLILPAFRRGEKVSYEIGGERREMRITGTRAGCRRLEAKGPSRNVLGEGRNGLTGYRIQYKRIAIGWVVRPIGVIGIMSKRLLYIEYLAFSLGAAHLPGRACATTLASSAAISPCLHFHSRNNGGFEIDSNVVGDSHVA